MKKFILLNVLIAFMFVSSCGTIFKPNQANKPTSGKVDIVIVALDAIGLLFFIVPGIVAFAVDYSNGTLFLPRGKRP